jgi:hypothetical protein
VDVDALRAELRAHCSKQLAAYMVPSHWFVFRVDFLSTFCRP